MVLPDVKVLTYAFRRDVQRHETAKLWLDEVVSGDSQFGLLSAVLSGVVPVTTHQRIFKQPTRLPEA